MDIGAFSPLHRSLSPGDKSSFSQCQYVMSLLYWYSIVGWCLFSMKSHGRLYRLGVQSFSLLLYNANYLFSFKACPTPGLNCYACPLASLACPIGSLQHFMLLRRIPFFLIGFFLLIGGTIGRMICGWACPIGLLQDLLYRIPVKKWQIRLPYLNYLKYGLLFLLVFLIPYVIREPIFCSLCLAGTLQGGLPLFLTDPGLREMVGVFFAIKGAILLFFLLSFLFIKRTFCRFFCPLGAIYSLFNSYSYLHLSVDSNCTQCNQCQKNCPMDICVYDDPNQFDCIRCLECTSCPHVNLSKGGRAQREERVDPLTIY